jgi:hypothetical protein
MIEARDEILKGLRADIREVVEAGKNPIWPSRHIAAVLVKTFGSHTTRIDSLSTTAIGATIQTHPLSEYYKEAAAAFGMPRPQVEAAAELRTLRRTMVLPHMPGTHFVTPGAIALLPDNLRNDTLRYWSELNVQEGRPAEVRIVDDLWIETLQPGSNIMMELYHSEAGVAALSSYADIIREGKELHLGRPETGTEQFWATGTPEATAYESNFLFLASVAMGRGHTNRFLQEQMY